MGDARVPFRIVGQDSDCADNRIPPSRKSADAMFSMTATNSSSEARGEAVCEGSPIVSSDNSREASGPDAVDRWCGPVMFWVSVASLFCLAIALHFHEREAYLGLSVGFALAGLSLFPLVWVELAYRCLVTRKQWRQHLWHAVFLPSRIGGRDHNTGTWIWLPTEGWCEVTDDLRRRVERRFAIPMIGIALLVVPMLLVEYQWSAKFEENISFWVGIQTASALIWFAFAFEFGLMLSLVKKRFEYCKKNWIDLVIVLLPVVPLLQAGRLGRLVRLQQVTKTVRVYRLRGTLLRVWRALLLIELVRRLINGTPAKELARKRELLVLKEQELAELRDEIAALERLVGEAATIGTESAATPDASGQPPSNDGPSGHPRPPECAA